MAFEPPSRAAIAAHESLMRWPQLTQPDALARVADAVPVAFVDGRPASVEDAVAAAAAVPPAKAVAALAQKPSPAAAPGGARP